MEVKNTCGDRTRITSTRWGLRGRCTRIIFSCHGTSQLVTYFVYVGAHAVEAARRATSPQYGQALGRLLCVELRFWVPNRLIGRKG